MEFVDDDIHSRPGSYHQHISQGIDDISEQSPPRDRSPRAHMSKNLPNAWQQDQDSVFHVHHYYRVTLIRLRDYNIRFFFE